jgi:hypothetical protein
VFQLQQEKRQLQDDFAQLLQEREQLERRCATFEREQRELGPRLEETKWEVCMMDAGQDEGGHALHSWPTVATVPGLSFLVRVGAFLVPLLDLTVVI